MAIQRLTLAMRNAIGLNKLDSRTMHVVSDVTKLNENILPKRYNVRNLDGSIDKYTIYDDFVLIANLKKNKNGNYTIFNAKSSSANDTFIINKSVK